MEKVILKSGLKVRINPTLSTEDNYAEPVKASMVKLAGRVVTVGGFSNTIFIPKESPMGSLFSTDMLVPLIDEEMLKLKKSML